MGKLSIANLLMAAVFGTAAVVQFNDPDPWRWIATYTAAALTCLAHGRLGTRRVGAAATGLALVGVAWGGILASRVLGVLSPSDLVLRMDDKGGAVEVGREAGGLAIVTVWMAVLAVAAWRERKLSRNAGESG